MPEQLDDVTTTTQRRDAVKAAAFGIARSAGELATSLDALTDLDAELADIEARRAVLLAARAERVKTLYGLRGQLDADHDDLTEAAEAAQLDAPADAAAAERRA